MVMVGVDSPRLYATAFDGEVFRIPVIYRGMSSRKANDPFGYKVDLKALWTLTDAGNAMSSERA